MLHRVGMCALAALLVVGLALTGAADDGTDTKKSGKKKKVKVDEPSPIADLREEHLREDVPPPDPIEYLRSYRDWIAEHEKVPPRTDRDRALYDVWTAALKPRATRMRRRIDTLMKRKYWLPETGQPERVNPKYWSKFTREIAGLGTELHGAWRGYDKAQIQDRKGIAGTPATRTRAPSYYGYRGYGWPAGRWRGGIHARQRLGGYYTGVEINSYRNLMNRYRRGWDWRIGHCNACERDRFELQKKKREYVADRKRVLDTTKATLEQQMLSLQLLAAAMQATEEHALYAELQELPEGHLLREPAESVLVALRDARLRAERYSGNSSAEYGQLLRGWIRAYKAGETLLRKEMKRIDAEEGEAADK